MLSLFGGAQRFILLIGDEGAILLRMAGLTVRDRCFAPSASPADRAEMEAMLAEAPRVPLLLLVDVLEQSFVKETVPPVGLLDEAGVLQRKLRTTFPESRIKGARYLGRDPRSARKDKQYLLVSVPETKLMSAWLEWARDLRNPVQAIALLPLESLDLATRLSAALHDKVDRPDWVVLVTRQRTGGFRQIVVHKGELVFSRLTQSVPPDASDADIAATIDREHKLTMGYLRRMSYNEDQGLDVIVLAQPGVEQALLRLGMPSAQLKVISPHDVAQALGMKNVATPDDPYGEIVHAAWVAMRRRPLLALMPDEIIHHRLGSLTLRAGYALTFSVVGYLSFDLTSAYLRSQDLRDQVAHFSQAATALSDELNHAIEIRGGYSVSAPEVSDTIDLYDRLQAAVPDPMPLLAILAGRLGPEVRANKVVWVVDEGAEIARSRLVVTFDILEVEGDVVAAMAVSDALGADLAAALPGLDVSVTGPPADVLPTQSLVAELDLLGGGPREEERTFTTEITVRMSRTFVEEVQQ